jgi:hypothetical protein
VPPWLAAEVAAPALAEPPAAEPVERPEPYLSKQSLAAHYDMSVRWVEQKIAAGLPVAHYVGRKPPRPRFRLSETDSWLRANGHLSDKRPKTRRPGTKAAV